MRTKLVILKLGLKGVLTDVLYAFAKAYQPP